MYLLGHESFQAQNESYLDIFGCVADLKVALANFHIFLFVFRRSK